MGLSAYYGKVPESDEDRFKVLNTVLESGVNHIDTANVYGDSEDLIGRWFKSDPSIRPRVFLATKLGISSSGTSGASMGARGDAKYVKECIEKSFERLGVDVIDLFYVCPSLRWIIQSGC